MRFDSQLVIAHDLPDVFDGVQLRAFGRQCQQGAIGGDFESSGHVPSGLIEHKNGMGAGGNLAADLGQVHAPQYVFGPRFCNGA